MRVQDLAEELQATRSELHQRLDQLSKSMIAIDLHLKELMAFPPPPPPPHSPAASSRQQNGRTDTHEHHHYLKGVKMEIPMFNGSNHHNWLFKTKVYFRLQQIPEHLKIPLVGLRMEGLASEWYQWVFLSNKVNSWSEFAKAVKDHFGASDYIDLKGILSKLSQHGTLVEYVREFECLINQVSNFSDDQLMSFFISGLSPDLRCAIQLHWPSSLHQAMQLAVAYEAHHTELRSSFSSASKK